MGERRKKALLLSIGYGQGHHSAAKALAGELDARGWVTRTHDPCAESYPRLFRVTQNYYHFCVRRAPWLWGVTYALTDTADWRRQVDGLILRGCTACVRRLLEEFRPDVVLCTYPLFAYMLDVLAEEAGIRVPYAVMVTDAIEISRPWMKTHAPLVCVIDELSALQVRDRYALTGEQVVCTGFPVRREFFDVASRRPEFSAGYFGILYGAYKSLHRTCEDVRGLLAAFSGLHLTVLGGERAGELACALRAEVESRGVEILSFCADMASLFSKNHIYIGKAGAATVFEAYAAQLPLIINYSLPGQEQGNLELIMRDGCGFHAEGSHEVVAAVRTMLANGGLRWQHIRRAMASANRAQGARLVIDLVQQRFFS